MKTIILSGIIILATQPLFAGDLQPLVDEPSRQDLFQKTKEGLDSRALELSFQFPHDAIYDDVLETARKNSIFGIDISHYTSSNLRFDLLKKQKVHFVYAKATQGTTHMDSKFKEFWAALSALPANKKVFRGAYHFLSSLSDPVEQADSFLRFVKDNGGFKSDDLPLTMDLEWDLSPGTNNDRWANHTRQEIVKRALAFLNRVREKTGKTPMIYTSRAWWIQRGIPESEFTKFTEFRVWIADYSNASLASEAPKVPYRAPLELWQFTDRSKLSEGYSGGLDANIFKGTEADFISVFMDAGFEF